MSEASSATPAARLIVVLGAGGVGKTTTAASLAMGFARRGLRSVVITVDPALRLAQALGLESLSNEPREVKRFEGGGSISALWIDAKNAFDELVKKYAGSPESAERILKNRLFRIIQGQLGGIEEYLGVEKVLSLGQSGDFDVCILDTPPSRHALDFLESPHHLIRFFDDTVLKAFIQEGKDGDEAKPGFFSKLIRTGKTQAIEIFKSFLGRGFISELGELLANLKPIHQVFRATALGIENWVKAPSTRFVGVSLFEPYPLDEVRLLGLELSARSLPEPQVLVVNKCLPATEPPPLDELSNALGSKAALNLLERYKLQKALREKIRAESPEKMAFAEVLRYSGSDLSTDHLLEAGRKILQSWEPKDPGLFLRP